jgi:hypothetical protein
MPHYDINFWLRLRRSVTHTAGRPFVWLIFFFLSIAVERIPWHIPTLLISSLTNRPSSTKRLIHLCFAHSANLGREATKKGTTLCPSAVRISFFYISPQLPLHSAGYPSLRFFLLVPSTFPCTTGANVNKSCFVSFPQLNNNQHQQSGERARLWFHHDSAGMWKDYFFGYLQIADICFQPSYTCLSLLYTYDQGCHESIRTKKHAIDTLHIFWRLLAIAYDGSFVNKKILLPMSFLFLRSIFIFRYCSLMRWR